LSIDPKACGNQDGLRTPSKGRQKRKKKKALWGKGRGKKKSRGGESWADLLLKKRPKKVEGPWERHLRKKERVDIDLTKREEEKRFRG